MGLVVFYSPPSEFDISKYRRDEPSDSENDEVVSLQKELQEERKAGERTRQQLQEILEREKKDKKNKIQMKLKELRAELETGQGVVQGLQEEYEAHMKSVKEKKQM
ncbi:hypothetical protein KC345_g8007 [Hortaea werneckii]|nr:hypothetical protein KC345_g8007 [Hortaea werneckii]